MRKLEAEQQQGGDPPAITQVIIEPHGIAVFSNPEHPVPGLKILNAVRARQYGVTGLKAVALRLFYI